MTTLRVERASLSQALVLTTALTILAVLPLAAQWPAAEEVDLDAIYASWLRGMF